MLLRILGLTTLPGSSSIDSRSSSVDSPTSSVRGSQQSSPSGSPTGSKDGGGGSPLNHMLGLRQGIINPNHPVYRAWRGLLIGAAAFTGIFVPWELGFGDYQTMYCLDNVAAWIDILLVSLFMADIGE